MQGQRVKVATVEPLPLFFMPTLLIHRARCIATQDDANTELNNASILIRDGRIERLIAENEPIDLSSVD